MVSGEREKPPKEALAIFYGRFYVDDAALRLYAAGEHLAEAIICMLEINSSVLTKYRKVRIGGDHGSKQSVVGKFLFAEMSGHPITEAISDLVQSKEWLPTIQYRDVWVHSKPPIVDGTGISYERRNRLQVSATHIGISFGGGDPPLYTVDKLVELVRPAAVHFSHTVSVVLQFYAELIKEKHEFPS